jgi:hypothetical protein
MVRVEKGVSFDKGFQVQYTIQLCVRQFFILMLRGQRCTRPENACFVCILFSKNIISSGLTLIGMAYSLLIHGQNMDYSLLAGSTGYI